jgi:hypothetical protein
VQRIVFGGTAAAPRVIAAGAGVVFCHSHRGGLYSVVHTHFKNGWLDGSCEKFMTGLRSLHERHKCGPVRPALA